MICMKLRKQTFRCFWRGKLALTVQDLLLFFFNIPHLFD